MNFLTLFFFHSFLFVCEMFQQFCVIWDPPPKVKVIVKPLFKSSEDFVDQSHPYVSSRITN